MIELFLTLLISTYLMWAINKSLNAPGTFELQPPTDDQQPATAQQELGRSQQ